MRKISDNPLLKTTMNNSNHQIFTSFNNDLISQQKYDSIRKDVQNDIPDKIPGKNISIYLSANTLNLLNQYIKENRIKNRSIFIETLLLKVLSQK